MRTRSSAARSSAGGSSAALSTAATGTLEKKRLSSKNRNKASLRTQGGSSRQVPATFSNLSTQPLPQPAPQASLQSPSSLSIPLAAQSINEPPPELDYDREGGEDTEKLPQPAQPARRTLKREGLRSKKTNSAPPGTQGNLGKSSFAGLVKVLANLSTQPESTLVPMQPQPLPRPALVSKASVQPPASPSIPVAAQSINHILADLDYDGEESEDNETPLQPAQPAKRTLKRKRHSSKKSNAASLRTQVGSSRQVPSNLSTKPQPTLVPPQPLRLPTINVRKASTQSPPSPSIPVTTQSINLPSPESDYDGEVGEDNETPLQPARRTLKKKRICNKEINPASLMTQGGSSSRVPATNINPSAQPRPTIVPLQHLPHPSIKALKASMQRLSSTSIPLAVKSINQTPIELDYDGEESDDYETPLQPALPAKRNLKRDRLRSKKTNSSSLRGQGGSSRQVAATLINLSTQSLPTFIPPPPQPRPAILRKASTQPLSSLSISLAAQSIDQPSSESDYGEEGEDNVTPRQPTQPTKQTVKRKQLRSKKSNTATLMTQGGSSRQVPATLGNFSSQPLPSTSSVRTQGGSSRQVPATLSNLSTQPRPKTASQRTQCGSSRQVPATLSDLSTQLGRNTASLGTQGGSSRQVPATLSNLSTQPRPRTTFLGTQAGSSRQVPATLRSLSTQPTLFPPQPVYRPSVRVLKASTQPPSSASIPLAAQSINQPPPELDYDEEGEDDEFAHDGEEGEDNEFDHDGEEGEDNEFDHDGEEGEDNEFDYDGEEYEDNELDNDGEEGEDNVLDNDGEEGEDNELDFQGEEGEGNELDYDGEEGGDNELNYDGDEGEQNEKPVQVAEPARRKGSWFVDVVDVHGTRMAKQLTFRDIWSLPPGQKVVVNWNSQGQPIEDSGGLLNRFLGSLARDFVRFPINYSSWKKVPYDYKDNAYRETIQAKFDIDSDLHKSYIFKSMGSKWRDNRQELWQRRNSGTLNRDQLIAMAPEGMDTDQWTWFVDYRLNPKTLQNAQKNKNNRKKQTMPHTCGSKSLARKRAEMELEIGRLVSRGEVWTASHKHADGTFVTDQARQIGEKIQTYESSAVSLPLDISAKDSLAHALGSQEHCGRVRGLGLGPCPSQVFGRSYRAHDGIISASSYKELQDEITALRSQVEEQNKKFDALMTLFTLNYRAQLPSDMSQNLSVRAPN